MKIFFYMMSVFCILSLCAYPEKEMVIIVPSYNNVQWFKKNIASILSQEYTNYRIIYIDDCSTDGTADLVEQYAQQYQQKKQISVPFKLIRNEVNRGALYNLYHAIYSCNDNAIIVLVDGDDWLANKNVLATLNNAYTMKDIWITHGKMMGYPDGLSGWGLPVPEKIIKKNAFRTFRCPSHLRTFYAWLFKQIALEDLLYNGEFYAMTWDQAILFPMFEMAGERHMFMNEILYVYNIVNPLSDNRKDPQLQNNLEFLIRAKKPYSRLREKP